MAFRIPAPGLLVDNKYRLAERIGGGGMGEVYRAENVHAGRSVAVKFLRTELAEDQELAQRFFQEAQAVNRIRHPNIVDVLDAGLSESGPYLVMEYLEGEAVGAALARVGRFEVDAAVATMIPVLEALDAAHRVGIIHRDLKPENIYLALDAAKNTCLVRLLDFGIAKVLAGSGPSPRTRTGIVFGTPDYLSPEQATGDGPLDGRSDLFAVGVLLYELLTGTRPFRAPTAVATAFRVVHAEPATLASAGVNVSPRLEAIILRLLEKDPSRRHASAGDVSRELERVVPDAARRAGALLRIVQGSRRGRSASGPLPVAEPRDSASARARASSPDLGSAPTANVPSTSPASSLASPVAPTRVAGGSQRGSDPNARGDLGATRTSDPIPAPAHRAFSRPSDASGSARSDASAPRTSDPGSAQQARSSDPGLRSMVASSRESSSRGPQVRPFPARYVGKFKVRGPLLSGVDRTLAASYGRPARDEVVKNMPAQYATDFRNDSINALVLYDLEALDLYMELATLLVLRDAARWREVGRAAANGELLAAIRTAARPADSIASALRRGVSAWSRLMSFGSWRIGSSSDRATLHVGELDAASLPLRLLLVGMVEETLRLARGSDVKAVITLGEIGFMPDLTIEFPI